MKLTDLIKLGGKPMKIFRDTSPGSRNVNIPSDVSFIFVTLQGAGGSGAATDSTSTNAGGGASGAAIVERLLSVTPGASMALVLGAGGASVTAANTVGNAGGNSTFGGLTARGGAGGVWAASTTPTATPGMNPVIASTLNNAQKCPAVPDYFPSVAGIAEEILDNTATVPFGYGAFNYDQKGGAPSLFAAGGNSGSGAGSLGSGGGGDHGTTSWASGPGGNGFIEIIYFSDGTVAVS